MNPRTTNLNTTGPRSSNRFGGRSAAKAQPQSITSLGVSPDEERRTRMIKYVTAMSIRMVCFILFFFVQGWWLLVVGLAAIVLPYFGVVAANTIVRKPQPTIEQPGGVIMLRDIQPKQ